MPYRYLSTPIYYVNDRPHLGHAYASIHADVMARYWRAAGHQVYFLTGADEHGEKIAKAAQAADEPIQHFVDRNAQCFKDAWHTLQVEPDHFVRTTDAGHRAVVGQVLGRLWQAGDIYLAEYEGLYSIGQERFVTEKELVDGKLPEDRDPPVIRREANYFFRMEKYRARLRAHLDAHPDLIQPARYRNEILQLLEEPIGDLSISRPRSRLAWGIPIPWDDAHVTYVWFDALLSYVSPLDYPDGTAFAQYWPQACHLIGKDILRTHTLFWLSIAFAAGIAPYRRLFVSGHLLGADGRKMSKSLNNGVDPLAAAARYGVDALRYTLVREVSFGVDGIISNAIIEQRLQRDLADDLGNLAARTLAMIVRYRAGAVPTPGQYETADLALIAQAAALPERVLALVDDIKLAQAVETIMNFVRQLNQYVALNAPWSLAKQVDRAIRLDTVLYTLIEGIRSAADLLAPVMPTKMAQLRAHLGLAAQPGWALAWGDGVRPGTPVRELVLFPKPVATTLPGAAE